MKHVSLPILVLFLLAVVGHVVVQANSVRTKNKQEKPGANGLINEKAMDDNFKGRKEQKIQGVRENKESPRVVKLSSNKENSEKAGEELLHHQPNNPMKNNLKSNKKQEKSKKHIIMRRNNKKHYHIKQKALMMTESQNGIVSYFCYILKMLNLQILFPFIKELCASNNTPSVSTTSKGTTTTIRPTTRDPRIHDFNFTDSSLVDLICLPDVIKIRSVFYGNPASCGMFNLTANFSAVANGVGMMEMKVSSGNFGNICPNTVNQLTGQYYCEPGTYPSSTIKVAYSHGTFAYYGCIRGNINAISLEYVQPSCTVNATADVIGLIGSSLVDIPTLDFSATAGPESPPGCKNAYTNMYARIEFQCQ